MRVGVLVPGAQRERAAVRLAPADVHEPGAVEVYEQHEVRAVVAWAAVPRLRHFRGEERDVVAELAQEPGEEAVQLVTEPAAAARDDLVVDRLELDREPPPGRDVEILERDAVQVGESELGEGVERRRGRARSSDPLEIGVDVHVGILAVRSGRL